MLADEDLRRGATTFVLELDAKSLLLIARLLHEFLNGKGNLPYDINQAQVTLKHLEYQTTCVSSEAFRHGVYTPIEAFASHGVDPDVWEAQLQIIGEI